MNAASPHRYDANELPDVPWKNGRGTTRELVCRPPGAGMDDFGWRVSIATIADDVAFSAFPGVDRCIALLQGGGVRLASSGGIGHQLDVPYVPFWFDGGVALHATLLAGPSVDFNTMTRRGRFHSDVAVLRAASALDLPSCGLLHAASGMWTIEGMGEAFTLRAGQGLWWESPARAMLRASLHPQADDAAVLLTVAIEPTAARASSGGPR